MRRRILGALIVMPTLALIAFIVPAVVAMRQADQRSDLLDLQRVAAVAVAEISVRPAEDMEQLLAAVGGPTHVVGLYNDEGQLIAGDGPAFAGPLETKALTGTLVAERDDDRLVVATPGRAAADNQLFVVRVQDSTAATSTTIRRSFDALGVAAALILGLSAAVGVWLARRLTIPLERITLWAKDLEPGPAPPPTGIAEVDDLGQALTDSREAVTAALVRERLFSSQVAHQLRTPVAAIRIALEAESIAPRPTHQTVLTETLTQLDRLEVTIASLLKLAREERSPTPATNIRILAGSAAEVWNDRLAIDGRTVTAAGPVVTADVDLQAFGHVLDVLIENAWVHGAGDVTVSVGNEDNAVVVDVADQGTGVSDDIFVQQYVGAGHGIGLRLARSLAESSGGHLTVQPAPNTTFRWTLPAGQADDAGREFRVADSAGEID